MGSRLVFWALLWASAIAGAATLPSDTVLERLAFGGCNFQWFPQNHWAEIAKRAPQLWLWNGDIIYADPFGPEARRREYEKLKRNEHYQAFAQSIPILGTWDDHDFGYNNVGGDYPHKKESQQLLLEFLDEPSQSPRWQQEGVYWSYQFGKDDKRTQIVFLDERYYRQAPGPTADILGEPQWKWLEERINDPNYDLLFLVSSSQALPYESDSEKWADYPNSREKLLQLLNASNRPTIILSGDKHQADISQVAGTKFPIVEFTSTGLTHSSKVETKNSLRVGPLYKDKNFGTIAIDWAARTVRLQIHAIDGALIYEHRVRI